VTGLRDPLLENVAGTHVFALDAAAAPPDLARPRQVHGVTVVDASQCRAGAEAPEADAVVSGTPGLPVGVVTADCVPVLLATRDGRAVAAVHAGWRGLAAGILENGVAALTRLAGVEERELKAALGPHAGLCCYEVDAPVLDALRARYGAEMEAATRPTRPGHARLDLGAIAVAALLRAGLAPAEVGSAAFCCTLCDPRRLPSYRRDGPSAGRMLHLIAAAHPGSEG